MRLAIDATIAPCSETLRESVRDACDVAPVDGTWRESLVTNCFLRRGAGAEVQIDHVAS
jgi:hypothetical protein